MEKGKRTYRVIVEPSGHRKMSVERFVVAFVKALLDTVATFLPPPLSFIVKVLLNLF